MKRVIFTAGCVVILLAAAVMFFAPAAYLRMPLPDAAAVRIDVPENADAATVASLLVEKKAIASAVGYRIYALLDAAARHPKPGPYDLKAGMSYRRIARTLAIGPARDEVTIRVLEGWTTRDIQKALQDIGADVKPSDFAAERFAGEFPFLKGLPSGATLEGYLYPDTYRVYKDQLPDALFRKQLQEFALQTSGFENVASSQGRTLRDVVVLASMIEKEISRDADRPVAASVFMNRLKKGMRLQSDATLNYVLQTGRSQLSYEELENASPYNTYRYEGLPPGPISNPGKASLDAALHPAETDYLYFLSDAQGKTYFAKTLEEHAQNRAKAFGSP